jgi:hypothetical protein
VRAAKARVVTYVPMFIDLPGSPPFLTLTIAMPTMEAMMPRPAKTKGTVSK